jgi:hypothetical protein
MARKQMRRGDPGPDRSAESLIPPLRAFGLDGSGAAIPDGPALRPRAGRFDPAAGGHEPAHVVPQRRSRPNLLQG